MGCTPASLVVPDETADEPDATEPEKLPPPRKLPAAG
jgi:hypothetical protein